MAQDLKEHITLFGKILYFIRSRMHILMSINYLTYWTSSYRPFNKMRKDAVDVFKPYKKGRILELVGREMLQAIRGLGNIIKGCLILPVAILTEIGQLLAFPFTYKSHKAKRHSRDDTYQPLKLPLYWLADGLAELVRGITQIITAPLTLLFKTPMRAIMTVIKGAVYAEDHQRIQDVIVAFNQKLDRVIGNPRSNLILIGELRQTATVNAQMQKALKKGQKTRINIKRLDKKFHDIPKTLNQEATQTSLKGREKEEALTINSVIKYFSLFPSFTHKGATAVFDKGIRIRPGVRS
jgi:hypothetical protein